MKSQTYTPYGGAAPTAEPARSEASDGCAQQGSTTSDSRSGQRGSVGLTAGLRQAHTAFSAIRHNVSCAAAKLSSRIVSRLLVAATMAFAAPMAFAADSETATRNIETVRAFYDAGLNRKDFDAASKFFGATYIQHNPRAEDGKEGFAKFLAYLRSNYPESRWEFKRFIASVSFVVVHSHERLRPSDAGFAVMDIFRLDQGKIVEHWDVVKPIPEKSANSNGMF